MDLSDLGVGARRGLPLGVVLSAFLISPLMAQSGQTGNFCVRDFQPGAVCTANDVRIEKLTPISVVEQCNQGTLGEIEAVFEALISAAGSPNRWDVGFFLALDGGSARDGDSCYHDYLDPPLMSTPTLGDYNGDGIPDIYNGPWFSNDPDSCGDIGSNTQAIKTLTSLRVACRDRNNDGTVDVSLCTSWDNNSRTVCSGVADAYPGTNSKCSCLAVEIPDTPPNASIAVSKNPPTQTVVSGETASFTITVDNTGSVDFTPVAISDPQCTTLTGPVGDDGDNVLETPEIWTYSCLVANVTASFTNIVTVTATPVSPLGNVVASAAADVVAVVLPDLRLQKSVNNGTPFEGSQITYTVTASNIGLGSATGVHVTDLLPPGVTFISSAASQGTYNSETGLWTIGALGPGATATLTITAGVNPGSAALGPVTNTASLSAINETDQDPGNNSASVDISPVPIVDLSVAKTDTPDPVMSGANLTFIISVSNAGPSSATNVLATDTLPPGVTLVSTSGCAEDPGGVPTCSLGTLAAMSSKQYTITVTVNPSVPNGSILTNKVFVSSSEADSNSGNNEAVAATTAGTQADLAITKAGADTVVAGNHLVYTITVQNAGPSDAQNVVVTDGLPAGVTPVSTSGCSEDPGGVPTCSLGTIAAGNSRQYTITVIVETATLGTLTNTATVDSATTDPIPGNNSDSEDTQVEASADVEVMKSVDNPTPNVGDTVTFTAVVTNTGPSAASGMAVTDALPAGLNYVSHMTSQGTYDSGTGVWDVGSLAVSGSATLTLSASVDMSAGGMTVTNTATITEAEQPDPDITNNSASASVAPTAAELSVEKAASDANPNVGDVINYTVTVSNAGPSDATGVQVTDVLPMGVTYSSSLATTGTYTPATGVWDVGNLAVSGSATLTIMAAVDTGTGGQTINNIAQITAADQPDPNSSGNIDNARITVQVADLSLSKSADVTEPEEADTVVFTVTVHNQGPGNATGVVVTDVLPGGLTFVSATESQGSYNPGSGVWSVGSLASGVMATVVLRTTVNTGTAGTQITNTADVTALNETDPDPTNNSASAVVGPGGADISVEKSVDNPSPQAGSTVRFSITVTNLGPSDATGVVISDPVPAGLVLESAVAGQGSYDSSSGDWLVGNLSDGSLATLTLECRTGLNQEGTTITNSAVVQESVPVDPSAENNLSSALIVVGAAAVVAPIPALSEWGLVLLAGLLVLLGVSRLHRRDGL